MIFSSDNSPDSIPDFCLNDACSNETFHNNPEDHKAGSYFNYKPNENSWLDDLYTNSQYSSAIEYNEVYDSDHFTHSPGIGKDQNGESYLDN